MVPSVLASPVIADFMIGGAASSTLVALLVRAVLGVAAASVILLAVPAVAVYKTVVAPKTVVSAAAPVTVISTMLPLRAALAAVKLAPLVGKVQSPASKVEAVISSL